MKPPVTYIVTLKAIRGATDFDVLCAPKRREVAKEFAAAERAVADANPTPVNVARANLAEAFSALLVAEFDAITR
jgi:hypothetical protein